jgi:thioredoxin-related protein
MSLLTSFITSGSNTLRKLVCARACMGALLAVCLVSIWPVGAAQAQQPSPHAIDIPAWFTEGFLDLREESAAAKAQGKQLLVYFGQDGCPYCRELMVNNFARPDIVDKTRANFVAIALNIWGDRETTWLDGRVMTEKQLAKTLKVQFTPTLLFIGVDGRIVTRLNGYQPPRRFAAVLDYVAGRLDAKQPLGDYLASRADLRDEARAKLTDEAFFVKPPHDLTRRAAGKPLAVLFETRHCEPCDEMHDLGFKRAEVAAQLKRFDVARFALTDAVPLTTPTGRRLGADAWARELGVATTPTLVFFDAAGAEVFRVDGYTRPFHLAGAFDYVASGAYLRQPEFQRHIQTKADTLRAKGQAVDLWR